MRRTRRNKNKSKGGAATVMPLKYFDPAAYEPSASAGHDLLKAIAPIGVRPRIGGRRKTKRVIKNKKAHQGGFVPSVMDGFVVSASKYITPLALFAGYKLMTRKGKKSGRRTTRRH